MVSCAVTNFATVEGRARAPYGRDACTGMHQAVDLQHVVCAKAPVQATLVPPPKTYYPTPGPRVTHPPPRPHEGACARGSPAHTKVL